MTDGKGTAGYTPPATSAEVASRTLRGKLSADQGPMPTVRDARFSTGFVQGLAARQPGQYPWLPAGDMTASERFFVERVVPWLARPRQFMGQEFTWAQQLETFNRSPLGRAVQVFDVGAEAIERTIGLAIQAQQEPISSIEDLSAAWRAGTLYYDVDALNTLSRGQSLTLLYDARRRLRNGEDIETVRADIYTGLGEYATRAQLSDTLAHILLDPINLLGTVIKPVERLHSIANAARFGVRVTDEAIGEMAVNVSRLEGIVDTMRAEAGALEAAGVAGEIEEIIALPRRLDQAIGDLLKAQMELAEAQGRALRPVERLALWLTGGLPMTPEDAVRWASRGRVGLLEAAGSAVRGDFAGAARFGWLPWMWFRQTPQSMAYDVVRSLEVTTQEMLRLEPDINNIFALIRGAEDAAVSPALRHLLLTPAGRANIQWLRRAATSIEDLQKFMVAASDDIGDIAQLSRAVGMSTDDFMASLFRGEGEQMWRTVQDALQGPATPDVAAVREVLAARIAEGSLTQETLTGLGQTFEGLPYSASTLRLHMMGRVADTTAQVATDLLGVSARGWWRKATDSLKAVETLVYLGVNPGYYVRNFVNNEFTMLARGVWGQFLTADAAAKVWERMGIDHPRLFSGFGAGQVEGTTVADSARVALGRAFEQADEFVGTSVRPTSTWLERATGRVRGAMPMDMGTAAANVERKASARAMTQGLVDSMGYYLRRGRAVQDFDQFMPGLAERLGDARQSIYRTLESCWTMDEARAALGGDIAISQSAWIDRTASRLGASRDDIVRVLGQDAVDNLFADLEPVLRARGDFSEIQNVFRTHLQRQQRHLDDMVGNAQMMDRAMSQMQLDGPNSFLREMQMMSEHEFDMMESHLAVLDDAVPRIRDIADPQMRSAAWRSLRRQQDTGWNRFLTLENERWQGVADGAAANKLQMPTDFAANIERRLGAIQDFHNTKNSLLDEFFRTDWQKAGDAARNARWNEIQGQLDELYTGLIGTQYDSAEATARAVSQWLPQEIRPTFDTMQANVRNLRRDYGLFMLDSYRRARNMPNRGRFFQDVIAPQRAEWATRIFHEHKRGFAALTGNPMAAQDMAMEIAENQRMAFANLVDEMTGGMAVPEGATALPERIAAAQEARAAGRAVDAYEAIAFDDAGKQLLQDFASRYGVSEDQIARDLVDGVVPMVAEYAPGARAAEQFHIMDARALGLDPEPRGQGLNALWQRDGSRYWVEMEQSAGDMLRRPAVTLDGLSDDVARDLERYMVAHEGRLSEARMASMRMAEVKRDAALLNYSRRTELDTFLGSLFPFSFWTTHSVWNWMLWSLDHPAVLSTYLKLQRSFATAVKRPGWPERMSGYGFPLELPGMPAWMGRVYIDPLRLMLPFGSWQQAYERMRYALTSDEDRIVRVLDSMLQSGQISQQDYDTARSQRTGSYWEAAKRQVNDGEDTWLDAFSLLTSPHAPMMWLYNASRGRPFQEGAFMPLTRGVRSLTRLFGWEPAGLNIEAPVRKLLGLPEVDQWDTYRTERQLTNMAAEGYPMDQIMEAMTTRSGPAWDEAESRAGLQYAVGGAFGFFGMPMMGFPPGEEEQRNQWEELSRLYDEKDRLEQAGEITQDADMRIRQYYDDHPAMTVKGMINDPPEERMRQFLVDQIWDRYNSLPTLNRNEASDQLGPLFQDAFLNRETRSYHSIPLELLQGWAGLLNPEHPFALTGGDYTPQALQLAPRDIAERVELFYQARSRFFNWNNVRALQNQYFMLDEGAARRNFRTEHPELVQYWGWRRDWIMRNPDVIPYVVDNPEDYTYPSGAALQQALAGQPSFRREEWITILGEPTMRLVADYGNGEPLPAAAKRRLQEIADDLGLTLEDVIDRVLNAR